MQIRWLLCASPRYLAKYGTPQQLEELSDHRYRRFTRAQPDQRLQVRIGGKLQEVNELVKNGTLQVLLRKADIESDFGSTAYVLFSQHRALPTRIRVFLEHLRGTRFERPIV